LDHLKDILKDGNGKDFFLSLAGGDIRSSKWISYNKKENRFYVFNSIDGSDSELTGRELMSNQFGNIGRGIRKGAFYYERYVE
jgi:hypothetical protein